MVCTFMPFVSNSVKFIEMLETPLNAWHKITIKSCPSMYWLHIIVDLRSTWAINQFMRYGTDKQVHIWQLGTFYCLLAHCK